MRKSGKKRAIEKIFSGPWSFFSAMGCANVMVSTSRCGGKDKLMKLLAEKREVGENVVNGFLTKTTMKDKWKLLPEKNNVICFSE